MEVDVGDLPDDVAATAYYVCAEGLTNVVAPCRGAALPSVRVFRTKGGDVRVMVTDDGAGGADVGGFGAARAGRPRAGPGR